MSKTVDPYKGRSVGSDEETIRDWMHLTSEDLFLGFVRLVYGFITIYKRKGTTVSYFITLLVEG